MRGGKVKTTLGLYNDTQDMEFLHTWALVPQAVYPLDQRGETIAHLGGDIYGEIPIRRLGSLNYTVYGGKRPTTRRGALSMPWRARNGQSPNEPMPFWLPADPASLRISTAIQDQCMARMRRRSTECAVDRSCI